MFNFRRGRGQSNATSCAQGDFANSPDSFIKISQRNKEIWDSSRAIYNADPNMIAERKDLEKVRYEKRVLRSFVPCPLALKNERFWQSKEKKKLKQRKSQQAPSGCSHLLAIKGMCHLAPPTCPTNDPPPFLATGKIVAGKFTQTFGSGNLQTLWLLPGWLNFVFSGPGMVMCVCRVFVSVWLMAQKDFKLFYCQSCKVSAAASFMRCVNSTFYWRIIQLKDWIVW